eukprot:3959454-Pyramimonas_sp.AAC.2
MGRPGRAGERRQLPAEKPLRHRAGRKPRHRKGARPDRLGAELYLEGGGPPARARRQLGPGPGRGAQGRPRLGCSQRKTPGARALSGR